MILALLRAATADDHRRAEAAMPSLDELAEPEGYAWSLRALHGFFAAWEPLLFAALAPFDAALSLAERRKLPLLERDLAAWDIAPVALSCPSPATRALEVPAALGAMYVLEGSTLGGRMIERHCAARLGVSPSSGGAFFHGYGADTAARWTSFGAFVETHVAAHDGQDEIIAGARGCFGALERWLARQGGLRSTSVEGHFVG